MTRAVPAPPWAESPVVRTAVPLRAGRAPHPHPPPSGSAPGAGRRGTWPSDSGPTCRKGRGHSPCLLYAIHDGRARRAPHGKGWYGDWRLIGSTGWWRTLWRAARGGRGGRRSGDAGRRSAVAPPSGDRRGPFADQDAGAGRGARGTRAGRAAPARRPDLTAPSPDQFDALGFIDEHRARDRAIVVHCKMGQGRTATVLAAHLIRHGTPLEEALRELRALCPGAVGSPEQERALVAFAARRDWLI